MGYSNDFLDNFFVESDRFLMRGMILAHSIESLI